MTNANPRDEMSVTAGSSVRQELQDGEYWFPYHYVAQFRDRFRHFFLDTWAINYASTIEYLIARMAGETYPRIVDIGCGDGRFSRELALAFPQSSVTGVDYSRRAINLATAMNQDVGNLQFMSTDITKSQAAGLFDFAVLMEVFEHIPLDSAAGFISAVRELLKPGGVLYLTVPHKNKPLEYKHFQHFTVDSITTYLEPHFDILEVTCFEKRSMGRSVLLRMLSNRLFILNDGRLLNFLYGWYKKHLFACHSERACQRIFVRATAK